MTQQSQSLSKFATSLLRWPDQLRKTFMRIAPHKYKVFRLQTDNHFKVPANLYGMPLKCNPEGQLLTGT